jgi:surface protein
MEIRVIDRCLFKDNVPVELRQIVLQQYFHLETIDDSNIRTAVVSLWCSDNETERRLCWLRFGHISYWDTSVVTEMSYLFCHNSSFNENISDWKTSNVTNMDSMFQDAKAFNHNFDKWDVSNVKWMDSMFCGAFAFNGSLNGWKTSSLTRIQLMFSQATTFHQPVRHFDTSQVKVMSYGLDVHAILINH